MRETVEPARCFVGSGKREFEKKRAEVSPDGEDDDANRRNFGLSKSNIYSFFTHEMRLLC